MVISLIGVCTLYHSHLSNYLFQKPIAKLMRYHVLFSVPFWKTEIALNQKDSLLVLIMTFSAKRDISVLRGLYCPLYQRILSWKSENNWFWWRACQLAEGMLDIFWWCWWVMGTSAWRGMCGCCVNKRTTWNEVMRINLHFVHKNIKIIASYCAEFDVTHLDLPHLFCGFFSCGLSKCELFLYVCTYENKSFVQLWRIDVLIVMYILYFNTGTCISDV